MNPQHKPLIVRALLCGCVAVWLCGLATIPTTVNAYEYAWCNHSACWPCDTTSGAIKWLSSPTFYMHTNLGSDSNCDEFDNSSWRNDFECALNGWELVGSSTFNASTTSDSDWIRNDSSDESDVAWLSGSSFDPDELAYTWVNYNCSSCCLTIKINETDIGFNNSWSGWTKGAPPPSAWHYNPLNMKAFRAVALHEIGHALGLSWDAAGGHEDGELATMMTKYPVGGWYRGNSYNSNNSYYGRHWPHADDAQGAHALYPSSSTGRDLAISRSRLGVFLNGVAEDLDPVESYEDDNTEVCPGGALKIEYTVENRGNETLSPVYVYAFLSGNIWITPTDTSTTNGKIHTLAPYEAETVTHNFYLPTTMSAGDYHVGVYVDPDDDFMGEASGEWNNGVHLYVGTTSNDDLTVLSSSDPKCQ